jgi:hypothetical protein
MNVARSIEIGIARLNAQRLRKAILLTAKSPPCHLAALWLDSPEA